MLFLLKFLPKNLLSRLVGFMVNTRLPGPFRVASMSWFAKRYKIDLSEAEFPIEDYPHIGGLFTRRLKPGLRPIKGLMVHPVDGVLTEQGTIQSKTLVQAKGINYHVAEFIQSLEKAEELEGGHFLTYYLCPTDYHRVHSPVSGEIVEAFHIPGTLWPVNQVSVEKVPKLFASNERLVIEIKQGNSSIFAVMVGATNVGKMTASFDVDVVTNQGERVKRKVYEPAIKVTVGDELGIFHMGSTVIMLYPAGKILAPPKSGPVRLGHTLA